MSAAIAPPIPARHSRALTGSAPAAGRLLLVVGEGVLTRLAINFVRSRPGSRAVPCGQADVVDFVSSNAVDLILLDIDASLFAGLALAAHVRAAERRCDACRLAVIVACTSSECRFRDCLVGGGAIGGVLKLPCDDPFFADCVDAWCAAAP